VKGAAPADATFLELSDQLEQIPYLYNDELTIMY